MVLQSRVNYDTKEQYIKLVNEDPSSNNVKICFILTRILHFTSYHNHIYAMEYMWYEQLSSLKHVKQ